VIVEEGASIWYGAVIRADYAPVIVRRGANVQDNAVIHGPPGLTTDVGAGATVGHNCVVHGAIARGRVPRRERSRGARRRDDRRRRARRGRLGRRRGRRSRPGCCSPVRPPRCAAGQGHRRRSVGRDESRAYAELAQRHRRGIRYVDPTTDDE
jgi:hypothetical protein